MGWALMSLSSRIQYRFKALWSHRKRNQLVEDVRKASKVLRPSEKPFFSPKAPSSKPWSAKPFMWSYLVHRSINFRRYISVCESSFDRLQRSVKSVKMTAIPQARCRAQNQPYETSPRAPLAPGISTNSFCRLCAWNMYEIIILYGLMKDGWDIHLANLNFGAYPHCPQNFTLYSCKTTKFSRLSNLCESLPARAIPTTIFVLAIDLLVTYTKG